MIVSAPELDASRPSALRMSCSRGTDCCGVAVRVKMVVPNGVYELVPSLGGSRGHWLCVEVLKKSFAK